VFGCEWHTNSDGDRSVLRNTDIYSRFFGGKAGDVIHGQFSGDICAIGLSNAMYVCKETGSGDGVCSMAAGGPALEELIECVNRETALCGYEGTDCPCY